jgi:hypothetical protein
MNCGTPFPECTVREPVRCDTRCNFAADENLEASTRGGRVSSCRSLAARQPIAKIVERSAAGDERLLVGGERLAHVDKHCLGLFLLGVPPNAAR